MLAAPILLAWHNDASPIYSVHFQPHGKARLATAGGDNNVRVSRPMQILQAPASTDSLLSALAD